MVVAFLTADSTGGGANAIPVKRIVSRGAAFEYTFDYWVWRQHCRVTAAIAVRLG